MQELWCRVYWRDREITENTIGQTQEGRRQQEQCETHKERGSKVMSKLNKSAITNHATTENHIIDWEASKGIHLDQKDKDTNEQRRGQLPHVYDDVIHH